MAAKSGPRGGGREVEGRTCSGVLPQYRDVVV